MLGALAAVALVVGGISTTAVLSEDQPLAAEQTREPVVEVLMIESMDTTKEDRVFSLTLTGIDPPLLTKTDPPVGVLGKRTQLT